LSTTKSDSDDSYSMVDDDYNEYGMNFDDEEGVKIIKKKQKQGKEHLVDLEIARNKGNVLDHIDAF